MFGYATDETPELMPLTHMLATQLGYKLTEVRKNGTCPWLRPDGKTQVRCAGLGWAWRGGREAAASAGCWVACPPAALWPPRGEAPLALALSTPPPPTPHTSCSHPSLTPHLRPTSTSPSCFSRR